MASQSANPGGSRNQDGAVCSLVSSVRGEADWNDSARVSGSHVILDDRRSRKQAAGVPGLLQCSSHPSLTERANTASGRDEAPTGCESPLLSMGTSLSTPVLNTDRCLPRKRLFLPTVLRNSARLPSTNRSL